MKKALWLLVVGLCCISECRSQRRWAVPKLQELTQADAIRNGVAHLSVEDTALLKRETKNVIEECVKDPGPSDPGTATGLFARLRVRRISLGPASSPGLVVQGFGSCMCGTVGNCPFWIIDEKPNPSVLLEAEGVQIFAFQQRQTAKNFDLLVGSHNSATMTDRRRFRFNGTKCRLNGCATNEREDELGNVLHPPRVTPEKCS